MRIVRESVEFDRADMHFVEQFGIDKAVETVLDYASRNRTPFICDKYQLAAFLCVPVKELFSITDDIGLYYKRSRIPKKTGGTREIRQPMFPLNFMQERILREILYNIPISDFATAYHPGARLAVNAYPHVWKKYLLKMDITDFFGSVRFDAVYSAVFNTSRYPRFIGALLTSLCCLDDVLPQGACTSPAISNIVMSSFDGHFGRWCLKMGYRYTRYSDDITVSGNTNLYPAYVKAKTLLAEMGMELNEKKTRFVTNASRQTVTGMTVNRFVRVPSDYKRKLRQELYYVRKHGIENAADYMGVHSDEYYQRLMGRLNYVLSVEPFNEYFAEALEELRGSRPGSQV